MPEDIKPKAEEAAKKGKEPAVPKTGSWSRRTQMGGEKKILCSSPSKCVRLLRLCVSDVPALIP